MTSAIETVSGTTTNWSENYGYDTWANRWLQNSSGVSESSETPGPGAYNSNNRINTWQYDAAGNILSEQGLARTFTYDAENRQTSATISSPAVTTNYAYDGEGHRVSKMTGSSVTYYAYDAMGQLIAEYGGSSSPCQTCYLTVDALGSTRSVFDQNNNPVAYHDYLPYGEEILAGYAGRVAPYGGTDLISARFTGKERDTETGLDNFIARYFSGPQGRFMSADQPFNDQSPSDPQSWNLFAYGRNNPLSNIDPTGGCSIKADDIVATDDPGSPCVASGSSSVTVTGSSPQVGTSLATLGLLTFQALNVGSQVGQQLQQAYNWVSQPQNWQYPSCVMGKMGTWGAAGTAGGAAVGGIGVAFGGVGEFVTVPAGAAIGGGGGAITGGISGLVTCSQGSGASGGGGGSSSGDANDGRKPPVKATKLRGNQGWRDENGNIWKKDMLHKDHWDVSDRAGNKIKEVTFDGRELWPNGPKNAR